MSVCIVCVCVCVLCIVCIVNVCVCVCIVCVCVCVLCVCECVLSVSKPCGSGEGPRNETPPTHESEAVRVYAIEPSLEGGTHTQRK